jgi:hypothetical protein
MRGLGRGMDGNSGRRVGVNAGAADMDFDEDRLILDDTSKVSKLLSYSTQNNCLNVVTPCGLITFSALVYN